MIDKHEETETVTKTSYSFHCSCGREESRKKWLVTMEAISNGGRAQQFFDVESGEHVPVIGVLPQGWRFDKQKLFCETCYKNLDKR